MNLRLVVAGATSLRRGEPKRTSTRHRCGGRRSCRPTADGDSQKDADQPVAAADNGLPCLLCSLNLPPAPFDIPPPVQVTVPVGVSLRLQGDSARAASSAPAATAAAVTAAGAPGSVTATAVDSVATTAVLTASTARRWPTAADTRSTAHRPPWRRRIAASRPDRHASLPGN